MTGYNHVAMKMLGRTNRTLHPLWIRGGLPEKGRPDVKWGTSLLQSAVENKVEVFDLSISPGYWGEVFRQAKSSLMISVVSRGCPLHLSPNSRAASQFVQAHLVEVLCAAGREQCDFYFLAYEHPLQEAQAAGALEALEIARQEGQIGCLGLAACTNPLKTLSFWRLHDAFEVLLIPDSQMEAATNNVDHQVLSILLPEASHRRVGVVLEHRHPDNADEIGEARAMPGIHAWLLTARSTETIRSAARRIR